MKEFFSTFTKLQGCSVAFSIELFRPYQDQVIYHSVHRLLLSFHSESSEYQVIIFAGLLGPLLYHSHNQVSVFFQ